MSAKGVATLTIEPRPLAARLRIRKGQVLRFTGFDGEPQVFHVTYVSMPDAQGRCEVRCKSTDQP